MPKISIFDYFPNLMAGIIFFIIINIFAVNGLPSRASVEPRICSHCKNFFNRVITNLPEEMDKSSGFQYFKEVIKEVCELPFFERSFSHCKKIVDYSRTTYQMWLLIRYNDNIVDKLHRLCFNESFCRFPQPKRFRQFDDDSAEFDPELKKVKEQLLLKSPDQENMHNSYFDYYV